MDYLGTHLLVELYGCEADRINDPAYIEKILKELSAQIGLTIIYSMVFNQSSNPRIATMIIEEGYFGIQSWSEQRYMAFDIHSNIDIDNEKALTFLVRKFGATKYSASEIKRGNKAELTGGQ